MNLNRAWWGSHQALICGTIWLFAHWFCLINYAQEVIHSLNPKSFYRMAHSTYRPRRSQQRSLLRPFYQFFGVFKVILKRQRHYLTLSLLALVNIVLTVGLINNASFFSQAVDRVVLLQELEKFSETTGRPPFSTSIYIFPSSRSPITLEQAEEISSHIRDTLAGEVGLPPRLIVNQVSSGGMMLQPAPGSELFAEGKNYLGNIEVAVTEGISGQMEIIEGVTLDEDGQSNGDLDVWIYESAAQTMGINIGDKLMMGPSLSSPSQTMMTIAGIWRAKDKESDYWFNDPDNSFKSVFVIRRADYISRIQPTISSGTGESSWYVILDETKITPRDGSKYLQGFDRAQILISKYLPGSRMNTPPVDPLTKFVARSSSLTTLLIGYNLPAFGILLYFIILTSTIMAQWQRRETVMLVSRGMSAAGVLNLTIIEQSILFIFGYPLGILFGMFIARVMGYTESFLTFTSRSPLPVSLEGLSFPLTLLALTFAMFSRLFPAIQTARSSLVMEERERARPMRKPFWYRIYLDIILIIPTYYAYDQMVKNGSLSVLVKDSPEDLYRDPLLIIVPALFILTVSLLTMRLFALFMRLVDLISGRIPWLTLHLALRQLGRLSLDYVQPMLLVIISLAMGVYTLSMAASLDQWAIDRMYYRVGADISFTPMPYNSTSAVVDGSWTPLPQEFAKVEGVQAATRVGDFGIRMNPPGGKEIRGRLITIDRVEFPAAAWFRNDFARESLGALMNRLAFSLDGILVPQKFLEENSLNIGDIVPATVTIETLMTVPTEFTIVGTYEYFPNTIDETIKIIGNLDYINTLTGLTVAHDIWVKTDPTANHKTLIREMERQLNISVGNPSSTQALINEEQGRMERVGIFGTLTVGFLATALMAILGLLIYSYASLQERAYRLAVLNAVGLSKNQIMAQVILEYAFLALFGAVAGALIGSTASSLFVPFFKFTGEQGISLPPLVPIIANSQLRSLSAIFGALVVSIEIMTIGTLLNRRLVQILKRVWI